VHFQRFSALSENSDGLPFVTCLLLIEIKVYFAAEKLLKIWSCSNMASLNHIGKGKYIFFPK